MSCSSLWLISSLPATKMEAAPVTTQPLSSSGCRRRPSARFQDQSGSPFPPKPNCNHQRSKHDTDLRSVSTGKSILEPVLEAHMWSIWNSFLYSLCKVQGTHPKAHSFLIPEWQFKIHGKGKWIILLIIYPNPPVFPFSIFHVMYVIRTVRESRELRVLYTLSRNPKNVSYLRSLGERWTALMLRGCFSCCCPHHPSIKSVLLKVLSIF